MKIKTEIKISERHKLYRSALKLYKGTTDSKLYGFCGIFDSCEYNLKVIKLNFYYDNNLRLLPEIYKYKPKKARKGSYWFPVSKVIFSPPELIRNTRYSIIKEAWNDTKPKCKSNINELKTTNDIV